MTNPNNAVGTAGAYYGRTSVDAFNDNLHGYQGRGILSGWSAAPAGGMNITIGGAAGVRDVAIAEDPSGNLTTINNISAAPITLTIPAASPTNSRIDYVIAYVNNPATVPEVENPPIDNPETCGLIVVQGTPSASPQPPSENTIRSAITADGGTGTVAYYVILASVSVGISVTELTPGHVVTGQSAALKISVDSIYPIGAIYLSVNATDPATIFGGAWTRIEDKFLLAAGSTYTAGSTGGEATHTLTTDELPRHTHGYPVTIDQAAPSPSASEVRLGAAQSYLETRQTEATGNGSAHNNMPPYLAVYIWQRTA